MPETKEEREARKAEIDNVLRGLRVFDAPKPVPTAEPVEREEQGKTNLDWQLPAELQQGEKK